MPPSATAATLNTGITRYTPRVLVFGLPRSGKTDLIQTIESLAAADTGVPVVPLTPVGAGPAIQGEVLPRIVQAPNPKPGSDSVIFYDCDGRAAQELVRHPDFVTRRTSRTALTETVKASHALVCLVNASASEGEVRATFREMSRFIGGFKSGRLISREVGGLPVFLVLTRCDELRQRGHDFGDWENEVEVRTDWLRKEFQEHFGSDFADADEGEIVVEGAIPPGFGTLDLRVRAVARELPSFTDTTAHPEPWQVRELFEEVSETAREFCLCAIASRKRLRATVAGSAVLLGTLLLFLTLLVATGGFGTGNLLADRVHAYQANEGPPEVRLADRNLAKNLRELEAIQKESAFAKLPKELQEFVTNRLHEFETYREYRSLFRVPRLGPAEVRSREQLDSLTRDLNDTLAPPKEFAATWTETDGVKLWRKWKTDLALFVEAESQLHDWHRTLIRSGNQLLLLTSTSSLDYGWRTRVTDLLRVADQPPYPPGQEIGPSPSLPLLRGKKLDYAAVYAFDRVDRARADWLDTRDRLVDLRDLTDALGLTTGQGSGPPVLDLPEPSATLGDSRDLALSRLVALDAKYTPRIPPNPDGYAWAPDHPEWSIDRFPDPVRKVLETRLRQVFATGARHVRRLILAGLGDAATPDFETHKSWKRLANTTLQEEPIQAWGRLLYLVSRWADSSSTTPDPVAELADFLRRDQFDLTMKTLTITIPNDLLAQRLTPNGKLVLTHTPLGGAAKEMVFRPDGDGQADRLDTTYTFVPEGSPTFTLKPGDALAAALPARSGGQDYRLVWSTGSSTVYHMDRLTRTPRLVKTGLLPVPEPAPGVRLTVTPPTGIPTLPVLFPELR